MFKKLFEGMAADENIIKLNITDMANDYPEVDYNELRDRLTDAGATVDGQVGNGAIQEDGNGDMNVYMLVSGVDMATVEDTVEEVVSEYEGVEGADAQDYVVSDTITGVDDDTDDVDIDIDDVDDDVDIDIDDDTDNVDIDDDTDNVDIDIDDDTDNVDVDIDDADIVEAVKRATNKILRESIYNRRGRRVNESYRTCRNDRFFVNGRLNEASTMNIKKGCCPGKNRRVNLLESLKAVDDSKQEKLDKSIKTIKDIIDSVKGHSIGAQEVKDAFAKLKKEQKALSKIEKNEKGDKFALTDVNGAAGALKKMKEADPSQAEAIDKFQKSLKESVFNALNAKKKSLHGKVSVNGQLLESMTNAQVSTLLTKVKAAKNKLVSKLSNSLNESVNTKNTIKNEIVKLTKLSNILDEENTYRTYATKYGLINEDENQEAGNSGEFSEEDLANMFGTGQGEETKSDNETEGKTEETKSDEGSEEEEVELARIVITMQDKDAAEDLKSSCIDAGIPEDAIEISEDTDEDEKDSEETDNDSDSEENKPEEDNSENTEGNSDTNEGIKYSNLRRLFEDEDSNSEEDNSNEEGNSEEDNNDDADKDADGHVKFILTDTDYALQLSKVLDDVYGISKEEFEDMIGGEIVDDSEDEEATDDNSDKDENTTDADNTEGSTEEDTIDPSELFKGM